MRTDGFCGQTATISQKPIVKPIESANNDGRQFVGGRGRGTGAPILGVATKAFAALGSSAPPLMVAAGCEGASGSGATTATGMAPSW